MRSIPSNSPCGCERRSLSKPPDFLGSNRVSNILNYARLRIRTVPLFLRHILRHKFALRLFQNDFLRGTGLPESCDAAFDRCTYQRDHFPAIRRGTTIMVHAHAAQANRRNNEA